MGKYPFWMYGPGWYMSPQGGMRFSYVRYFKHKLWDARWHAARIWYGWRQWLDDKLKDWTGL